MFAIQRLREVCDQIEQLIASGDKRYQDLPAILADLRILQAEIGDARPGPLAFVVVAQSYDNSVDLECPIEPCPWRLEQVQFRSLAELLGEAMQHMGDEHR